MGDIVYGFHRSGVPLLDDGDKAHGGGRWQSLVDVGLQVVKFRFASLAL